MTSPTAIDVDAGAFYTAATRCFEVAADLHDAFAVNVAPMAACAEMGGSYADARAWAASYDERTKEIFGAINDVVAALQNYGSVLIELGHNHELADYGASAKPGGEPARPPVPPATQFAALSVPQSAGGPGEGLIDDTFGLIDKIGIPVPDGDSDKLGDAADVWKRLGTVYQTTNSVVKIDGIADLFADVASPEVGYVYEDLLDIRTAISESLAACVDLGQSCREHQQALIELRSDLVAILEDLAFEVAATAAITIAAALITFGAGAVVGGAKAAATVVRFAGLIRKAIIAWQGAKRLATGVKTERNLARARAAMQRIKDLGHRGEGRSPRAPVATPGLWRSEFENLPRGKQSHVRLARDDEELRSLFDRWTAGFEQLPARGDKVPKVFELPDGTTIQWRIDSRSGGSTIDIFDGTPGGWKVHVG